MFTGDILYDFCMGTLCVLTSSLIITGVKTVITRIKLNQYTIVPVPVPTKEPIKIESSKKAVDPPIKIEPPKEPIKIKKLSLEEFALIRSGTHRIEMKKGCRYQNLRYMLTYDIDINIEEYLTWHRLFHPAAVNNPDLIEMFKINDQGKTQTLVFWRYSHACNIKGADFFMYNQIQPTVQVVSDVDVWEQLLDYMRTNRDKLGKDVPIPVEYKRPRKVKKI